MNHHKFSLQAIVIVFVLLFLAGCDALTISTAIPSMPSPVPSTPTPVAQPPSSSPPLLTDGADTWQLTTVTIDDTITMGPDTKNAGANMALLLLEFECVTGKMLDFPSTSSSPDYNKVYVTDSQGEKHISRQFSMTFNADLSGCQTVSILFEEMPKDRHGFTLYFADLPPLDLGQ